MYHDSRDEEYRMPLGAQPCGTPVRLRLKAEKAARAWLRLWWDGREIRRAMERGQEGLFEAVIRLPERTGLLWYYFIAEAEDGCQTCYGNGGDQLGGVGTACASEPPSYQITVYDPAYETPEWLRDGVMLQIMVDRYRRAGELDREKFPRGAILHEAWEEEPLLQLDRTGANAADDFFGGNLRGVEEKLEYIRSLGVTVIYFNPIFASRSNHKYDVADYTLIDPSFGTEEDFRRLCEKAAGMGIRVILDGVFSHTGADSVYFDRFGGHEIPGAYRSKESPYFPWYRFDRWPDA